MREELESRVLQVKKALFYLKTAAKATGRAITSISHQTNIITGLVFGWQVKY